MGVLIAVRRRGGRGVGGAHCCEEGGAGGEGACFDWAGAGGKGVKMLKEGARVFELGATYLT